MTITLHLPPDKHVHFIRAVWRINQTSFTSYWIGGVIFCGFAANYVPIEWREGNRVSPPLLVGLAGVFLLLSPSLAVMRIRRRLAKVPDEPGTVTINEERIFVVSPSANVDFAWTLVNRVLETHDSFILRHGRGIRAVLPKEEFVGDDLAAFRRLLVGRGLVRA